MDKHIGFNRQYLMKASKAQIYRIFTKIITLLLVRSEIRQFKIKISFKKIRKSFQNF